MAIIKLRGELEPIEVSNAEAKYLQGLWLKSELPEVINAGETTFSKRDLKAILSDDELNKIGMIKNANPSFDNWLREHNEMVNESAGYKAEQGLSVLNTCLACFGGDNPYDREVVIQEFTKFFEENPYRCLPDWDIIKNYFPSNTTLNSLGSAVLKAISFSLIEDKKYA